MKGLLLKDLFVLRKSAKVFIGLIGLYLVMAVAMHTDFGVIVAFIMGMLSMTSFAYDEQAKWDAYALTLPVSRRDMVAAKYLMALLLGAAGALAGILLSLAASLGHSAPDLPGIFRNMGLALCGTYVFSSLALPLLYKLGAEKTRLVLMLCYAAPILLVSILINMVQEASALPQIMNVLDITAKALPFFTLAALALSYRISLGIFLKKDV